MSVPSNHRWLLLIHQIPDKPGYLRVKVWRRLQRIGAVPVKNSVYVLPRSEPAHEDLQWVLREITAAGGDASVCEARFINGMTDDQIEALFRTAREKDYDELAAHVHEVSKSLGRRKKVDDDERATVLAELTKLKRRLAEIIEIDFFGATGREAAEGLIAQLAVRIGAAPPPANRETAALRRDHYQQRTWVTRKGIHVDRIASGWLIRRFIDPAATFKFVPGKTYKPEHDELRFDMFDAEFTHEGDRCTFETLLARFAIADPGLVPIAEIVHDIDLKDEKFDRPDTAGVDRLILGIALGTSDDEQRLAQGATVFENLYNYFGRKGAR